jgi:hypothetical protein
MATVGTARTPAQTWALVIGVVYLAVGIIGFFVTGFSSFASNTTDKLIIFELNPLHNIVHIVLGAVWIGAARTHATARQVNLVFGVVLLLIFVLGLLGALKWLSINDAAAPDNYLHLVTGALSLYFGTAGAARTTTATA